MAAPNKLYNKRVNLDDRIIKLLFLLTCLFVVMIFGLLEKISLLKEETVQVSTWKLCDGQSATKKYADNESVTHADDESVTGENGSHSHILRTSKNDTEQAKYWHDYKVNKQELYISAVLIAFSVLFPFVPIAVKYPSTWTFDKVESVLVHLSGQASTISLSEVFRSLAVVPDLNFLAKCNMSLIDCVAAMSQYKKDQIFSILDDGLKPKTNSTTDLPVLCPNATASLNDLNDSLHSTPDYISAMVGASFAMFLCNAISWIVTKHLHAKNAELRRELEGTEVSAIYRRQPMEVLEKSRNPNVEPQAVAKPAANYTYCMPQFLSNGLIMFSFVVFVLLFCYYLHVQTSFEISSIYASFFFGLVIQLTITVVIRVYNVEMDK